MPKPKAAKAAKAAKARRSAKTPISPTEKFFAALHRYDEAGALAALRDGADPSGEDEQADPHRRTSSLGRALGMRMEELARELLPRSDLLALDHHGWSVLTSAASAGNLEALKAIAAVDDPGRIRHEGGVSALMCAAESGSMPCVEFLAPISNIFARDCYGLSALEFAAKTGSVEALRFFLDAGLPPDNPAGPSALSVAAERGRSEAVAFLLPLTDLARRCPVPRRGARLGETVLEELLRAPEDSPRALDLVARASPFEEAERAVAAAARAGVDLPTARAWTRSLREALDLESSVGGARSLASRPSAL